MYNSKIHLHETNQKRELEIILKNSKKVEIEKILNYPLIIHRVRENDENAIQYFTDNNIDKMINFCLGENFENYKKKEFCKLAFNSAEILSSGSFVIKNYFLKKMDFKKTREDSFLYLNDNFEKKKNYFFGSGENFEIEDNIEENGEEENLVKNEVKKNKKEIFQKKNIFSNEDNDIKNEENFEENKKKMNLNKEFFQTKNVFSCEEKEIFKNEENYTNNMNSQNLIKNEQRKNNKKLKKEIFQKKNNFSEDKNIKKINSSKSFSNFKNQNNFIFPNFEKILKIFENPNFSNPTIISYIQKIINSLITNEPYKIITYLYKKNIIDNLLKFCSKFDSVNLIIEKIVNIHYEEETLNFEDILEKRKIIYEKILEFILDDKNKEIFGLSNIFLKLYNDKSYILDSDYFLANIFLDKKIILKMVKKIKKTHNLELCDFVIFFFEKIHILKKKRNKRQESISKIIDSENEENSDIIEDISFQIRNFERNPSLDSKIRNLQFTIENELLCEENSTMTNFDKELLKKKNEEKIFFEILKKIIFEIKEEIFDLKIYKKVIHSDGKIENGIFYYKIKLLKIFRKISENDSEEIIEYILQENFFENILGLFFLYPKNNILHFEIMKILENIIDFLIENFETKKFEKYFYFFLDHFTGDFYQRIEKINDKKNDYYFLPFYEKLSIFINTKIKLIKYIFYSLKWNKFEKNYLKNKLSKKKFLISNPVKSISKKSSLNIDRNNSFLNLNKKKNSFLFQNFSSSDEEEIVLEENDSGIFKQSTKYNVNEELSDDDIDKDIELVKKNMENFKFVNNESF